MSLPKFDKSFFAAAALTPILAITHAANAEDGAENTQEAEQVAPQTYTTAQAEQMAIDNGQIILTYNPEDTVMKVMIEVAAENFDGLDARALPVSDTENSRSQVIIPDITMSSGVYSMNFDLDYLYTGHSIIGAVRRDAALDRFLQQQRANLVSSSRHEKP